MAQADIAEEGFPTVIKENVSPLEAQNGSAIGIRLWVLLLGLHEITVFDVNTNCLDLEAGEGISDGVIFC